MGNSSAKEQRPPPPGSSSSSPVENARHPHSRSVSDNSALPTQAGAAGSSTSPLYSSRSGRSSRPDLSFLSLGHNSDRDVASLESRREAKQEKEARRIERERVGRERERERSMREESVDGGYLVTQGVYTGPEDYNKAIVRRLMIERRLAPFFKGLNEHSASWRDDQLVAAVKGLPIPAELPLPPHQEPESTERPKLATRTQDQDPSKLMVEIGSRSTSYTSESSANLSPSHPAFSTAAQSTSSPASAAPSSPPFRPRSKTLASLTSLARNHSQDDMIPQEIQLPKAPLVDGRPIEAFLYRDASECPICFLFYPPYPNRTRCCDQAICSECFVQIKRPDPHPPEHADPNLSSSPAADARGRDEAGADETLVSEPAACPFCVQPELGVTYEPPPFRSGLAYANQHSSLAHAASAMSSSSSLSSFSGAFAAPRRRTTSLSATAPTVVTTDRIRPDWSQKLANARAHAARRSAAATALHTAAYLMGGFSSNEGRSFPGFGRRNRQGRNARTEASASGSGSGSNARRATDSDAANAGIGGSNGDEQASSGPEGRSFFSDQSSSSTRRSRIEELEDLMMMEAIRLSLASEEERKRKEDKEARERKRLEEREARERESARRRAERNIVPFSHFFRDHNDMKMKRLDDEPEGDEPSHYRYEGLGSGKGKAVDRRGTIMPRSSPLAQGASSSGGEALGSTGDAQAADLLSANAVEGSSSPPAARHVSGRTSPVSSLAESPSASNQGPPYHRPSGQSPSGLDDVPRASTPGAAPAGPGTDSVFAFRSLAAMVETDEKPDERSKTESSDASSGELHGR